ncbi:unnamed protein product [Heligmosomoides polygyrus]|uniref:Reverse transcriptase domain-containing protein n=1 Tax=Heligmosomoides polygyrus TaxID=6339 RepID=A0A183F541_HELPZ|nr:unnamed protein product [Heligmosomoides polygyrus]
MLKAGGTPLAKQLTTLFNNCWHQQNVPEDWKKGLVVKLPKKGNLSDCGNWRGITLLSVPGKVFCTVLLRRLRDAIDDRLREEQAGFRNGRSCCDQIFTLRNIIEQCLEYRYPLHINFVDFKKAFDSVHRESLWEILKLYGVPTTFVEIFRSLYQNSMCCVKTTLGNTSYFEVTTGVRQGCVLSPLLFNVALDFVMRRTTAEVQEGIPWFRGRLMDLDFVDDIAVFAEENDKLQRITERLSQEAGNIGLRISPEKSKVMCVGIASPRDAIYIGSDRLEVVNSFTYLGSMIANDGERPTFVVGSRRRQQYSEGSDHCGRRPLFQIT